VKIINLTPHPVNLLCENGASITFKTSGTVARVDIRQERKQMDLEIAEGVVLSIPVVVNDHVEVYGLPEPQEGVFYIVSSMVASAVSRPDILSPNTDNSAERDGNGRVTGVRSLQQIFNMGMNERFIAKFESYLQVVATAEKNNLGCTSEVV
jgi:hypothetical protein